MIFCAVQGSDDDTDEIARATVALTSDFVLIPVQSSRFKLGKLHHEEITYSG